MINLLKNVEEDLLEFLQDENIKFHTMYIDYHYPYVKRIWFQYASWRVYLHCIEAFPTEGDGYKDALFHPHPWQSVVKLIHGEYEMGVGHSETNEIPKIDCKLFLSAGSNYEMTEENGWHYVYPIDKDVYSLMITGIKNERVMPLEPDKKFRKLDKNEILDILPYFDHYYKCHLTESKIIKIVNNILKND